MVDRQRPGWTADDAAKVVALDTKVEALDGDVKQIHSRIEGLETKFDNVADSLAGEFRAGIQRLATSFNERSNTNWPVVFAGAGVAVTVVIGIGTLALLPISTALNDFKIASVPRPEYENKILDINKRSDLTETWLRRVDGDRRQDARDDLMRLQRENYDLHNELRRAQASIPFSKQAP